MKNVLFFTSPIGLGHATRDVAVASRLRQDVKKLTFVSGQGASKLLFDNQFAALDLYRHYGFDISDGEFRKRLRWLLRYLAYHNECKKVAKKFGFSFDDIYRLDELLLEKLNDARQMVKINNGAKAANLILNLLT
ncbi:MAG: hypothetical protein ACE5J2_08660 [Nitrososphaerales archaeon]